MVSGMRLADSLLHVEGIIQRVDALAREVAVRIDGVEVIFDVPADCVVLLYGERVKLRLLQPQDRAVIAYSPRQLPPTAQLIEVMNWT